DSRSPGGRYVPRQPPELGGGGAGSSPFDVPTVPVAPVPAPRRASAPVRRSRQFPVVCPFRDDAVVAAGCRAGQQSAGGRSIKGFGRSGSSGTWIAGGAARDTMSSGPVNRGS